METPRIQSNDSEEPAVSDRLLMLVILLGLATLAVREIGSPDAGFHLATGRSILSGEGWPRTDSFTYTVRDHPYIDTSWGYDVLVALVERVFGAAGLVFLHAGFVVVTFSIVLRTSRIAPAGPCSGIVLLLLGGLLSEARFEVRPEMLSYGILALVLDVLQRYSEGRSRRLWPLVPLFLLWSNFHALYVIGWVVLVCFVLGTWIRDRAVDRRLLAWAGACVAAGLVNPYGWQGLRMSLVLATRLHRGHVFHENIGEYESPLATLGSEEIGFYILPIACLFAFLAVVLSTIPRAWRQRRQSHVLLSVAFMTLALSMVRNAPLLAVACLPGTAWTLHRLRMPGLAGRRVCERVRVRRGLRLGVAALVVLFVARVCTDAYYVERGRLERFGWRWNRYRVPVDAAAWVRGQPALAGRMLNDLDYGGYLIGTVPHPVFVDGRLEVMGEEFFEYYKSVFTSADALEECVARYGIGWAIFPYRRRPETLQRLSQDPRWRLVYADHDAVVFARIQNRAEGPETAPPAWVEARPRPEIASLPGLAGPVRRSGLERWLDGFIRRQTYPVEAYSMGVLDYLRGDWEGLAAWSAEAIRTSRHPYGELYGNLGSALFALGDLERARLCLEIAVDETPWNQHSARRELRALLGEVERELRRSP